MILEIIVIWIIGHFSYYRKLPGMNFMGMTDYEWAHFDDDWEE